MILKPLGFDQLEGWEGENFQAAMNAFLKTAHRMIEEPYPTKGLGISSALLTRISKKAVAASPFDTLSARIFFEKHFQPCEIKESNKSLSQEGFVTAYYEPEVFASRTQTREFTAPLYKRPHDLVDVTDKNRPMDFDDSFRFARQICSNGVVRLEEYPDRKVINSGYLKNQGLEIAWVKDVAEALFIHIQGSARLRFENGESIRVGYAAKTGHPYTAVGKVLLEMGALTRENCGMSAIRNWFAQNPDRANVIIEQNRSYIFFNEYPVVNIQDGPVGAAKVPLTTGRSLAVDRNLHTFGTPVWISSSKKLPGLDQPFHRLMVAQDTGSAIIGPARGDLFLGSGEDAGKIAGEIRHKVKFVVFVPKSFE